MSLLLRKMQLNQQRPHIALAPLHKAMHRCRGVCRTLGRLAFSPIHPHLRAQNKNSNANPPRQPISGSNPPFRSNTPTPEPKFQSHILKVSLLRRLSVLSLPSCKLECRRSNSMKSKRALLPKTAATTSSCAGAPHAASCAASCTCACGSSSCASCARCPS